ncbi:unnamed protein product [Clonostachys chloroleuca]|uniref:F-box domain-containing protein n=1 Tax=Clonostachys chloroleuca TaxID=1926264 RepID=A0AA35M6K2_9HYPO|nr:unnamed protein product [Clonostachys chloroleuca]
MEEARGSFSSFSREILDDIVSYLPNKDKKSLRQASSFFAETVKIRISRVFLSANPRNIEVIEAISNHETRRHHVEQLIWDDSFLAGPDNLWEMRVSSEYGGSMGIPYREPKPELIRDRRSLLRQSLGMLDEFHELYAEACAVNIRDIRARRGNDCDTPAHLEREEKMKNEMPISQSVRYFKELYDQQEDIICDGQHIRAFRTALYRFPNLKKVTITPVCHGFLFTPLYETPMIRDFPRGFNYPIPRSWPSYVGRAGYFNANRWLSFHEASKITWNAVHFVLKDLALRHNRVTELEINVHGLDYGVPVDMFHSRNEESGYFNTVASKLRRLDLSIEVPALRTGNPLEEISQSIRQALDHSPDLEHFSLHCNRQGYDGSFPPLRTLFPIDKWKWLEHFGLTRFKVDIDDLVDFLSSMPDTLSSLELGFFRFQMGAGGKTYYDLMQAMRNKLGWSTRSEDDRPRIVIRVDMLEPVPGRYITADKEVEDFIYGDGPNPFSYDDMEPEEFAFYSSELCEKGILHDEFDPAYERPNLADEELVALGIIKDARHIEDLPYDIDDESEDGELEDDQDCYDYDSQDGSSEEDDDYEWSDSAASE